MFELQYDTDNKIAKKELSDCFDIFSIKRGKLPSFSVCVDYLKNIVVDDLVKQNVCGSYTFYNPVKDGYWFSFNGSYLFLNNDYSHSNIYLSDNVKIAGQFEIKYLTMQAYMFRLVDTGNFMIHSAAVIHKDECILFCGMSGAGKSTQANLWKKYLHCDILNYDKPCVINDNGTIYAHGSPWSGKEKLVKIEYFPLKAIVFIKQSKDNQVVKLSHAKGFSDIYMHNYVYPINKYIEEKYINAVNNVVKNTPIYELYCDISENAVETLYNE